ncbi:MAG: UDP-N-acetylmuramate dehydrogenase [Parcubacteria group bacterium Gr01-1014_72]|nr:MAG: UDP-N-acetylmuramate dehydrogenase [Parcubacteria group bacterium Gr01-1014_72]
MLVGEFDGLLIKLNLCGMEWSDRGETVLVKVASGEGWDAFVEETVTRGLYGVENLSGIPGTVGAAPIQNIGAYGAEVKDVIHAVDVFDTGEMRVRTLTRSECRFGYRTSIFKTSEGKGLIVVAVTFLLAKTGTPNISYKDLTRRFGTRSPSSLSLGEVRRAVLAVRREKFPPLDGYGTAGSFFKNPIVTREVYERLAAAHPTLPAFPIPEGGVKLSLAWILDKALGLKGFRKGAVGLYEKQPLVLVNFGGATAAEVESFAKEIAERVREKIGIEIEWEVEKLS